MRGGCLELLGKVFPKHLINLSNLATKNCLCGIRSEIGCETESRLCPLFPTQFSPISTPTHFKCFAFQCHFLNYSLGSHMFVFTFSLRPKIPEKFDGALQPFDFPGGQVLHPPRPLRRLSRLLWDPLLEKVLLSLSLSLTLSQHLWMPYSTED